VATAVRRFSGRGAEVVGAVADEVSGATIEFGEAPADYGGFSLGPRSAIVSAPRKAS